MECLESQISALISLSANGEPSKLLGGKNLNEYIKKILALAEICLWTTSGKVEAIVATYANDPEGHDAFITMVTVSPQHRKKGLAKSLLAATLSNLSTRGFKRCSLEVQSSNTNAINLYHSVGFKVSGPPGEMLSMSIELST